MSSRRNLVRLAAESASAHPSRIFRRSHGSRPGRAAMRPQIRAVAKPCSASRAIDTSLAHPFRPFHSTSLCSQNPRRTSQPFHLTSPHAPRVHPHSSAVESATPLPEQFRSLMRLVSHSVVVCTSTLPAGGESGNSSSSKTTATRRPTPRAMTMSSFTSLSLLPTPVVSFNIATPSRTYDAVAASRRFNVHLLADDVSGAAIADWLARGNASGRDVFDKLAAECGCGVDMGETGDGKEPPVLKGDGVLYVLRCKLLDQPASGLVRVRDHVIVLGEVMEILEGRGAAEEKEERFGLLYADRMYRQLGNCIITGEG